MGENGNRFLIVCGGAGYRMLGQRDVLGLMAELQIDVSKENASRDWKVKDVRSLFMELDRAVGTAAGAINRLLEDLSRNPEAPTQDVAHMQLLSELFPVALSLERSLAQSPAVGRAVIEHPINRDALAQVLDTMITNYGRNVGPQNPVEVWIISSTAGGTGEGTHAYVGRKLAEYQITHTPDTPFVLNFIRVGQMTYASVNKTMTALDSFIGVAMDAALMLQIKKEFPLVSTHWFYLELPDMGKGDTAKLNRGEIIEMACKAIMLPELQADLERLLMNNIGAPVVLVRTGFWGSDLDNRQTYLETLKQLSVKLAGMLEPDDQSRFVQGRPVPEFNASAVEERLQDVGNTRYLLDHMDEGWIFPNSRQCSTVRNLKTAMSLLAQWKNTFNDLLGSDLERLPAEFLLEEVRPKGDTFEKVILPLSVPNVIAEDAEWFTKIENAQRVRAWADVLLGVNRKEGTLSETGLLADLLTQAEPISKIYNAISFFNTSESKARKAGALTGNFLMTLAKVNRLVHLEESASRFLVSELSEVREVYKKTRDEIDIARRSIQDNSAEVVRSAELSDILDQFSRRTWLRLLRDDVRKGDHDGFRNDVLRGANGLSEVGLRAVLGLKPEAGITDIQITLGEHFGHMLGWEGNEIEGQWWQGVTPEASIDFNYRILPQVERSLQESLKAAAVQSKVPFRYVFTQFGSIGLNVLAFHAISLNQRLGDTVSAPAALLKPLVGVVQEALQTWPKKPAPGKPAGQLEVAAAGTIGQPLYLPALKAAGLTQEEINKLAEYYQMAA